MPRDRERYEAMLLVALREYEVIRSEAVKKIQDLKNLLRTSRRSEQGTKGGTPVRISKEALLRAERRLQVMKSEQLRAARQKKRTV